MVDPETDAPLSTALLRRHAELEELQGDGDSGRFLSGWQCENPWSGDLRAQISAVRSSLPDEVYQYLDNDTLIADGLISFHSALDGITPRCIFPGEGSSSLLFTTLAWLKEKGVDEIYYIPPLYFSAHFALKLLGIRARPVSGRHALEEGFTLNLPNQSSTLLLSDPIWYAGVALEERLVDQIAQWQKNTESFVLVDGSFQYMKWDRTTYEPTSRLDIDRTVRIVCPTKCLALHGYRFAHAIIPAAARAQYEHTYANLYGSASAESIAFGRVAATALLERQITKSLVELVSERHARLRSEKKIASDWNANCGYFIFERVLAALPDSTLLMDGSYFEQKRYPDNRRINLLSPSIGLLG